MAEWKRFFFEAFGCWPIAWLRRGLGLRHFLFSRSPKTRKGLTKKSKNALENRVFDFALVSPSEYEKG